MRRKWRLFSLWILKTKVYESGNLKRIDSLSKSSDLRTPRESSNEAIEKGGLKWLQCPRNSLELLQAGSFISPLFCQDSNGIDASTLFLSVSVEQPRTSEDQVQLQEARLGELLPSLTLCSQSRIAGLRKTTERVSK